MEAYEFHILLWSLFNPHLLQGQRNGGEIGKGACEKRKERGNKVDWCNPLCPGTKGSNSNENMPTSRHRHKQNEQTHTCTLSVIQGYSSTTRNKTPRSKTKAYVCVPNCLTIYACVCVSCACLSENKCSSQEPGTTNQCQ